MRTFLIFIAVVIVLALFALYFFWWRPLQTSPAPQAPPPPRPASGSEEAPESPAPPLSQGSLKVDASEIKNGAEPATFFRNIEEAKMLSYNLLPAPESNPVKIHFETAFNKACSKYVWYKHWLYINIGVKDEGGYKSCFYHKADVTLPAEIRLYIPITSESCVNYHFYLSAHEYRYVQTLTELQGTQLKKYCTYKKQ